jgi:two-component system OmpR family response regulator
MRIVVAEDDVHLLRVISMWLERNGFEVLQARNGREGLDLVRRGRPDILITDVNMPEIDGVTLARTALEEAPHPLGVIVLSCRVDMVGIGAELGDERVLHHAKPFSPSRLIEEVQVLHRKITTRAVRADANPARGPCE